MGLDQEDYARMCSATTDTREHKAFRQHANAVALSAEFQAGLTICDLLRKTYGDEKGRKIFHEYRNRVEFGEYPQDIVSDVLAHVRH